mmetsp:Transcript_20076/g.47464  ORF Transcript_20076/g.47464 Transcript_20076/m.47464 type:complete len:213 (+) Transcript_20076:139-777(+)
MDMDIISSERILLLVLAPGPVRQNVLAAFCCKPGRRVAFAQRGVVDSAAQQGHGGAHALQHHLPQLASDRQTPGALAAGGLHEEKLTSGGGDPEARGNPHRQPLCEVRLEDLGPEDLRQLAAHRDLFSFFGIRQAQGRPTANLRDPAFKAAHSTLGRPLGDQLAHGLVCDAEPRAVLLQAMQTPLLWQQVSGRNVNFLLHCVAREFYDLHAV